MKVPAIKIEDIKEAKYGDLIFFSPLSSWSSKLQVKIDNLRQPVKQPYCHVAIYWGEIAGKHHVFEAQTVNQKNKQIGLSPLQEYRNYVIVRPMINKYWLKPRHELMALAGVSSYQYSRLLKVAQVRLLGMSMDSDDISETICTELGNWEWSYMTCDKAYCTPVSYFNSFVFV